MSKRSDSGFTLVELLIVVAVIGIIAAIAVPGLLRARIAGNEASAIASLRVVNSAQQAYMATCGNGFYASDADHPRRAGADRRRVHQSRPLCGIYRSTRAAMH